MKILALDTETSGLDPQRHAIVSLGLAVMEHGEVLESIEFRLGEDPKAEYDIKALQISGITWKGIKEAKTPQIIFREACAWLDNQEARVLPVVSHNAAFDAAFISQWTFKCGMWSSGRFIAAPEIVRGPWWCTRRLMSPLGLDNAKLDTIAGHFGLARSTDLHGALEDAVLAGQVFDRLQTQRAA